MPNTIRPISFPEHPHHEVTRFIPEMSRHEYEGLVQSIAEIGLLNPILLDDKGEQIVDGRYRYMACKELGIEPKFQTWDGVGNLARATYNRNCVRQHFTKSQMAMVARNLMNVLKKEEKPNPRSIPKSDEEWIKIAAKMSDVSASSVRNAVLLGKFGSSELDNAVFTGKISVSAAAVVAVNCSKEEQLQILAGGQEAVAAAAKRILETKKRDSADPNDGFPWSVIPWH